MREGDNDAGRDGETDAGLALLLGGGVAEAMAMAEATLATVRGAAKRAFAGLGRVQAVGGAAAAVPPLGQSGMVIATPPELSTTGEQVRLTERFTPPPAPGPAGAEHAADFASVSVPAGSVAAFAPAAIPSSGGVGALVPVYMPGGSSGAAALAPVPVNDGGTTPVAAPASPPMAEPMVMPMQLAAFAPPAPSASGTAPDAAAISGERVADSPRARGGTGGWVLGPIGPSESRSASATSLEPPRAHAPPISQPAQSGPTGGDVFLDGTRVGTWLADHLAREAGRPQTGGTGFDPRLTPAWPGTLQGG